MQLTALTVGKVDEIRNLNLATSVGEDVSDHMIQVSGTSVPMNRPVNMNHARSSGPR
jgi:hypothetical protein